VSPSTSSLQPLLEDLPPLLSSTHLAELFDVSRSTIWEWAQSGILPQPLQLGPRCNRWPRHQILEHLEALRSRKEGVA
jgi:predicted DNA-binding transcriptional regulator AlpA